MNHFLISMSHKYNLDNTSLQAEYKIYNEKFTKYNKMKKPELVEECTKQSFKSKGTKEELIVFLIDEIKESEVSATVPKAKSKTSPKTKVVIEKMQAQVPTIVCRKNKFGLLQIDSTDFVFEKKTQKIVGRLSHDDDGQVVPLNSDDIEECKKLGLDYVIPENLDSNEETNEQVMDENINDLLNENDEQDVEDEGGEEDEEGDEEE